MEANVVSCLQLIDIQEALCCFSFFSREGIWGSCKEKYALEFTALVIWWIAAPVPGSRHAGVQSMECGFSFTVPGS